jgi:hypothetical protein
LWAILGSMAMQGPLTPVGHRPPQAPRALRPARRPALTTRRARRLRGRIVELGRQARARDRARATRARPG